MNDPANCGACGNICPANAFCGAGSCLTLGCAPGYSDCNGLCVDLATDPSNCGACGNACPANTFCGSGTCIGVGCAPGYADCNGLCVDLESDPNNCGSCGHACAPGQACCGSLLISPFGLCVDLQNDVNNCGGCGNACPANAFCGNGTCLTVGCAAPLTDCNGACVDLQNDVNNCGSCGNVCAPGAACFYATCWASPGPGPGPVQCGGPNSGLNCMTGLYCCHNPLRCIAIQTDPNDCGSCGNVCPSGQSCQGGTCVPSSGCSAPLTDCNGVCVDLQNDVAHCGACGNACMGQVTGQCVNGVCQIICLPDSTDCNGTCVALAADPKNCGACGHACGTGESCTDGVCIPGAPGAPTCPPPTAPCNGTCVEVLGDPKNCGACSHACGTGQTCVEGTCRSTGEAPPGGGQIGRPDVPRSTASGKGTITFYSSWPMSGGSKQSGEDLAAAVRMALEDFGNAAGGFALAYEALDDAGAETGAWDVAREEANARRVVDDPDAMAYIATYNSGAARVAIPILNEAQPGPMAMISPANTYAGLTKKIEGVTEEGEPEKYYPSGKRNYMRMVPADDVQGTAGAHWALTGLGARTAYVLHDGKAYGRGLATLFRDTFADLGGEIRGFEAFDAGAPGYQALATAIADTGPALVYVGAVPDRGAGQLLRDLRRTMADKDVVVLGPDGLVTPALTEEAGEAAEGVYATSIAPAPEALKGPGADWYKRMKQRLGHEPEPFAVCAYEAAVVAIQAIDRIGIKDRTKILDAMLATKGFRGLRGTWRFTETGDTSLTTVSLAVVRDGELVFQETIAPPEN